MNVPIIHPMIGEEVSLNETDSTTEWWKNIEPYKEDLSDNLK